MEKLVSAEDGADEGEAMVKTGAYAILGQSSVNIYVAGYLWFLKVRLWYLAVLQTILLMCFAMGLVMSLLAQSVNRDVGVAIPNMVMAVYVVFAFLAERDLDLILDAADNLTYLRAALLVMLKKIGVTHVGHMTFTQWRTRINALIVFTTECAFTVPILLIFCFDVMEVWYLAYLFGMLYAQILTIGMLVIEVCRLLSTTFVKEHDEYCTVLGDDLYTVAVFRNAVFTFRGKSDQDCRWAVGLFLASLSFLNVGYFVTHLFGGIVHIVVGVLTAICVLFLLRRAHQNAVKYARSPMCTGMLVTVVVFISAVLSSAMADLYSENVSSSLIPSKESSKFMNQHISGTYPVCLMGWGSPGIKKEHELGILDLGVFAEAVYQRGDDVMRAVRNGTDGTDIEGVVLEELEPDTTCARWGVFKVPKSKMRVIAVRGTDIGKELLQDADLFASVALLQASSFFFPVLSALPRPLVRLLLEDATLDVGDGLWNPLLNATRTWKEISAKDGYNIVITGHSLGGAYTAIAAARLGLAGVAFSPPGIGYTLPRYHIKDEEAVQTSLVAVKPMRDPVPAVDSQIGFTQNINCHSATSFACHSIDNTICELYDVCGDPRGRSSSCPGCPLQSHHAH